MSRTQTLAVIYVHSATVKTVWWYGIPNDKGTPLLFQNICNIFTNPHDLKQQSGVTFPIDAWGYYISRRLRQRALRWDMMNMDLNSLISPMLQCGISLIQVREEIGHAILAKLPSVANFLEQNVIPLRSCIKRGTPLRAHN